MPWFCKKSALFVCLRGLDCHLEYSFKSILGKKQQNFSMQGPSFVYCTRNVSRSAPIPRNLLPRKIPRSAPKSWQVYLTVPRTYPYYHQRKPPEVFFKNPVLKNFPKFTAEKFKNFTKIARNFSKNRLLHSCFPVKLAIILRTSFLLNISRWLLYRANCIIIKCRFLISETTIAITKWVSQRSSMVVWSGLPRIMQWAPYLL